MNVRGAVPGVDHVEQGKTGRGSGALTVAWAEPGTNNGPGPLAETEDVDKLIKEIDMVKAALGLLPGVDAGGYADFDKQTLGTILAELYKKENRLQESKAPAQYVPRLCIVFEPLSPRCFLSALYRPRAALSSIFVVPGRRPPLVPRAATVDLI